MIAIALPVKEDRDSYARIDRETKTSAIKDARASLVGIESLIEQAVNANPPRFKPKEARAIRGMFTQLAERLENVMHLLAVERDEFEQLNLHITTLINRAAYESKQLKESQEARARLHSRYMKLRLFMENEGMKFDKEDDEQ